MTTLNDKHIFDAANDFRLGSEILESKFGQRIFPLRSTVVTSAFSAELYLKCLLTLEGHRDPRGHSLEKLYCKLSDSMRKKIEAKYKSEIKSSKGINEVLKECQDIFVDWRYIYEKQNNSFHLDFKSLRNLVVALDKTVRELKPEWE